MHSVVVPIRNFAPYLDFCLCGLRHATAHSTGISWELVIVDAKSQDGLQNTLLAYPELPIRWLQVDYPTDAIFNKCVLLNIGIREAAGEIISVIDADCIVNPDFFFMGLGDHNKRCYRVLRRASTDWISNRHAYAPYQAALAAKDHIGDLFINTEKLSLVYEPYGQADGGHLSKGLVFGNSHFTTYKEILLAIGGYDERNFGRGKEDLDVNRRIAAYLGDAYRPTIDIEKPLICLTHPYKSDWLNNKGVDTFEQNKKEKKIRIENKQQYNYNKMELEFGTNN